MHWIKNIENQKFEAKRFRFEADKVEETLDLHGSKEWFIACWNRESEEKKKWKENKRKMDEI